MKYLLSLLIVLIIVSMTGAFAEPMITLDKKSYVEGDTIRMSGRVPYDDGMFVLVQLRSPSDIVAIDQISPNRSGLFSISFEAEGPKWQQSGVYTVMVSYQGQTTEKTFQFSKPELKPSPEDTAIETAPQQLESPKPKIRIKGFPDVTQSPQHYYDRYSNEAEFREWFDSTFAGQSIQEIVGYKPTHVPGFPDPKYSPQYYVDRYTNEPVFQSWFDAQFPERTIYDIAGVPEASKTLVPIWVKQYARWWSSGSIDDLQFASRISDLIKQNILTIDGEIAVTNNSDKTIPYWFKNNARWYADGHITEEDFLRGIEYLVENQIILI